MANSSIIPIPQDLDDSTNLRRLFDSIIQAIDELAGNRGNNEVARASDLVSTATTLDELRKDFNNLDKAYVRQDGRSTITGVLKYSAGVTPSADTDLITVGAVNALIEGGVTGIEYVEKNTSTAPAELPNNATLGDVISTINALRIALINAEVLS